jgi:transcriptional regulator with XRE-family HTH domain
LRRSVVAGAPFDMGRSYQKLVAEQRLLACPACVRRALRCRSGRKSTLNDVLPPKTPFMSIGWLATIGVAYDGRNEVNKVDQTPLATTVGKAIANRRVLANLTQEQVAEKLGIGQEAISRMERGVASPTVARLAELADIYRCDLGQLLSEASDREDDQAKVISAIIGRLPSADRLLLIEWMKVFADRLLSSPKPN